MHERTRIMGAMSHTTLRHEPPRVPRMVPNDPVLRTTSRWFFLSPDGLAVGPYATERNAESQAVRLAKILKNLGDRRGARVAVVEFLVSSVSAPVA